LTGRADLQEKAEAALRLHAGLLASHPISVGQMLIALDFWLGPVQEVAVVGDPAADDTRRVLRAARTGFHPRRVLAFKAPLGDSRPLAEIELLAGKTGMGGVVTTYICQNFACQAPLVGAEAAEVELKAEARA
jgi:uncharacterized protein YyaL (SSP411 family)